jgi:GTP-binding protein
LQEDRALVSDIPGTTRDSTDTAVTHNDRPVILVDTAGIRKRGHIDGGVERYSVMRAMRAISRSDVAVLVIDATEPIAAQDAHIAGYVWEAGKGLLVVVNKWDLVVPKDDHTLDQFTRRIKSELHFVRDVPILFTSALTRQRVRRILDLALEVKDHRVQRVPTGELNNIIQDALRKHQPMSHSGRMLKLRYVTQVAIDPPTFVFFVNDPTLLHFSYRRFLENQLREQFGFSGTAIRLIFRSSRDAPETAAPRGKSGTVRKRPVSAGRTTVRKKIGDDAGPKKRQTGGTTIVRRANRPQPKP